MVHSFCMPTSNFYPSVANFLVVKCKWNCQRYALMALMIFPPGTWMKLQANSNNLCGTGLYVFAKSSQTTFKLLPLFYICLDYCTSDQLGLSVQLEVIWSRSSSFLRASIFVSFKCSCAVFPIITSNSPDFSITNRLFEEHLPGLFSCILLLFSSFCMMHITMALLSSIFNYLNPWHYSNDIAFFPSLFQVLFLMLYLFNCFMPLWQGILQDL